MYQPRSTLYPLATAAGRSGSRKAQAKQALAAVVEVLAELLFARDRTQIWRSGLLRGAGPGGLCSHQPAHQGEDPGSGEQAGRLPGGPVCFWRPLY